MAEPQAAAHPQSAVKILFVGDIVGGIGRLTLFDCLPLRSVGRLDIPLDASPKYRERCEQVKRAIEKHGSHNTYFLYNAACTFHLTNRENFGTLEFRFHGTVITDGNHTYHRREIYPYLEGEHPIVRPVNFLRSQPGRGACVVEHNGARLGVVSVSGNLYLRAGRSAFTEIEVALGDVNGVDHILVDMHAEATSEKVAMGWLLDGRVTAVVGTHTHVPTADARVLPGGTAYITDVGMTGPRGGVIGVKREQAIQSLRTQMPVRFETSEEDPWLMGVLISCSQPLRADSIEQVLMPRPAPTSPDR